MTNAERIRNMNDDEFARFLCKTIDNCGDEKCPASGYCYYGHNGMIDWLNEESIEDEDM